MSELEQLRRFARDVLAFAARAEQAPGTSVAPSDAFEGKLGRQWEVLLKRARKLTRPAELPN